MARTTQLDKAWAGRAFLVPPSSLSDALNDRRRYYSTASRKFTDTSLGGHFALNPLSQFTENCDFPHKSVFSASNGMGRWYSEVIDDNSQLVHIRCGVPKFNSMTNFFGNFYNVHAGAVARTGRGPDIWFHIGKAAGIIGTLPLQPFIMIGSAIKFALGMPRSKFYYLKPTMYPYWYAVNNMVNGIMVNLGLTPNFLAEDTKRFYDPVGIPTQEDESAMSRIYGEMINSEGGLDFFALSTKAQRLADRYRKLIDAQMDQLTGNPETRADELRTILLDGAMAGTRKLVDRSYSLSDYEKAYLAVSGEWNDAYQYSSEQDTTEDEAWLTRLWKESVSNARMGADFVTFRCNHTGTQSESFSNSMTQPTLQSEINGISSKARMARFNIADGNIAGPIGWMADKIKSVVAGTFEAFQIEGFLALAGNAFADIQKTYEASSADLNRTTLTIPLRCWAADDWLRLKNLFIPLCGILALGLPRATGRASYDGPFLLEVFNQGRTQIREGMIESISVERGVGDIGWTKTGKPLGIDVTITIVDLSTILSMPINPGFSNLQGAATLAAEALGGDVGVTAVTALSKATYGEDNKYTDYLATLASLPFEDQISTKRRWKLAMARGRAEYGAWKSPARISAGVFDSFPGDIIKMLSLPTDRA